MIHVPVGYAQTLKDPKVNWLVDGDHAGLQPILHRDDVVILQIFTDARKIGNDSDAVILQQRARANAGKLQKLRRVHGATAEDHFLRTRAVRFCPPWRYPRLSGRLLLDRTGCDERVSTLRLDRRIAG